MSSFFLIQFLFVVSSFMENQIKKTKIKNDKIEKTDFVFIYFFLLEMRDHGFIVILVALLMCNLLKIGQNG